MEAVTSTPKVTTAHGAIGQLPTRQQAATSNACATLTTIAACETETQLTGLQQAVALLPPQRALRHPTVGEQDHYFQRHYQRPALHNATHIAVEPVHCPCKGFTSRVCEFALCSHRDTVLLALDLTHE